MNNKDCVAEIISRREFRNSTGSLSGGWEKIGPWTEYGELPTMHRSQISLGAAGANLYVVRSYDTPILFIGKAIGGAWEPDVKYSVTTSRHQGIARQGI